MSKNKKPLTGWRRTVRNASAFLLGLAWRRLVCCFQGHESFFGPEGSKLHFQAPLRRQTRTVHVCKRCARIYSRPKLGDDPAKRLRIRDLY